MMLEDFYFGGDYWECYGDDSIGQPFSLLFRYNTSEGIYWWQAINQALDNLGFYNDGFYGTYIAYSEQNPIPFPEGWYLDEEGIHLEGAWDENDWPYYANYLHILPYWHYAE